MASSAEKAVIEAAIKLTSLETPLANLASSDEFVRRWNELADALLALYPNRLATARTGDVR